MSEIIQCPECGQKLRVQQPRAGHKLQVHCPNRDCGTTFDWPLSRVVVAVQRGKVIELNERRSVTTHAEPLTLDEFESFGKPLQRQPDPRSAEFRSLHFRCSIDARPFTPVVMKERIGQPFRLVSNGAGGAYLGMLKKAGCTVQSLREGVIDYNDIDLSGFACGICGYGKINGDARDYFHCLGCHNWFCARSVVKVHNGPETAYCPICKNVGTFGNSNGNVPPSPIAASAYVAERAVEPEIVDEPEPMPRLLGRVTRKLLK